VSRLLLLDGHSLAYRAFFALPVENFSTTTGQHTNAVFGFTSMLINVLRDESPRRPPSSPASCPSSRRC
jgi:DNA polymerase I